ncbi:hypothetical protein F8377_00205 [Corynebacterium zhongnanshanii]|uniref:Uncharacterized protein n=1 Tax=Corynebacterium zhongnanshanii TaxID=2768834 RepID=A0ABQ6VEF4_9CORY|nr:hypothetical protein [Corynebacterium zhongnanshanii]KAB3522650.1 hypothetical protein F8377_00205 [Corynebacterium zhongnanshanii]
MFQYHNSKYRTFWLVLSIAIAAVALFGALPWTPVAANSTGLLWAIFILMVVQSYSLYKEGKQSEQTT